MHGAETGSNEAVARALLSDGGMAMLATLEPGGGPVASYVLTAPDADGAPLTLISRLARHTQNLSRDPRASLLFVREPQAGGEPMAAERLTLTGRMVRLEDADARRRFLARHRDAERYAALGDFSLYRFEVAAGHLVAGFGRIVDLTPEQLLGTEAGA